MEKKVLWVHAPGDQQACDLSAHNDLDKKPSRFDARLDITLAADPFVRQQSAPASISSERLSAPAASAELDDDFFMSEDGSFQRHVSCPADSLTYGTGDSSYNLVRRCLSMLIESLSMANFQRELQKLLMEARASNLKGQQVSRGSLKLVPGRCELLETVENAATTRSGIGISTNLGTWKTVARFMHEEAVLQQFSIVEELLALPPNDYFKVVLQVAKNESIVHSGYIPPAWRLR